MKPFAGLLAPAAGPLEQTLEETVSALEGLGEPRYRAKQLFQWIHQRSELDVDAMTNLPLSLRAKLRDAGLVTPLKVRDVKRSSDGTHKLVLEVCDGFRVETVLIPSGSKSHPMRFEEPQASDQRTYTQCLSTQVGCAMGCGFCASGVAGLKRHLTASEVVAQVHVARKWLAAREPNARLDNFVFMGMGEPLHNYDGLARALVLMNHVDGLNISLRRITVSTSGIVPQLDKLGRDFKGQVPLAISLHAVTDTKRSALMPVNKAHNIESLIAALKRYPKPPRQRHTIEYTLIAGINDSLDEADALAELLKPLAVKINLIPMNPIDGSAWKPPEWSQVEAFQDRLQRHHLSVFVRKRRGDDVAAACGQLALHGAAPKRRKRISSLPVC